MSGKTILEAAKAVGLTGQTIAAVDARGDDPKGAPVNLPDKAELLRAAFASDVGLDEAALNTKDGGFVWFDVTKIDPAHDLTFEEAKPEVEKQWRAEQVDKALAGKADDLVKQISAGGSIAEVGEERGRRGENGDDVHRAEQAACRNRSSPPSSASPRTARARRRRPDGRMVFKITADRTPPVDFADARVKAMASEAGTATRDESARPICRRAAPHARRRPCTRTSSNPPRAADRPMTTLPDYEAFARAYIARRSRGRGHDAGRRPRNARLGLSQARARPARATCSCSNRSRAARSAAAIR